MKKLVYFIAVPVLLIALGIVALEQLSDYHPSVTIHSNAPVKTTKTITINASPEVVWTAMTNVNEWNSWLRDIENPKLDGAFTPGNSFAWESGGLSIVSTIHTAVPYQKLGRSGPAFGSFAIHNWSFTALPDHTTRVDVEESMEGWLVQAFPGTFQSSLDASLERWLGALKAISEKNAIVVINNNSK